jgi:uncharacterized phage protein (TIGR02218 family)
MKAISPALQAHYALGTTTIARCWRIQRKDGVVVRVNSTDTDIPYPFAAAGEVYQAKAGGSPSAIVGEASGAVQNSEMTGLFDASTVSESDIYAGLYDGAQVAIFEVNYADLTMGHLLLQTGTIGNVQAGRMAFQAEVRGLMQSLQQPVGRLYQPSCSATLGDARCKVNLPALVKTGALTAVDATIGRRKFTDTARTEYQTYFDNGIITWTSGLNNGLSEEIASFVGGVISLKQPMPYNVAVGDTYSIVPGCNKLLTANLVRYGVVQTAAANVINDATRTEAPGTYIGGSLTFTSGANNGNTYSILGNYVGQIVLTTTPANAISIFDGYLITPPATASFLGDCKIKFNNVINFRGFPRVPGNDTILGLGGMPGAAR